MSKINIDSILQTATGKDHLIAGGSRGEGDQVIAGETRWESDGSQVGAGGSMWESGDQVIR